MSKEPSLQDILWKFWDNATPDKSAIENIEIAEAAIIDHFVGLAPERLVVTAQNADWYENDLQIAKGYNSALEDYIDNIKGKK